MIKIPIPIATKLNSEAKPGRHTPEETPMLSNARLELGTVVKSMGWSTMKEFGVVLDAHIIAKNKALVVAADSTGCSTADIYFWDMSERPEDTFTKLTMPAGVTFATGYDTDTDQYAPVFFEEHFDTRITIDVLITVTSASSGVLTYSMHDLPNGTACTFSTTGNLPDTMESVTLYLEKINATTCYMCDTAAHAIAGTNRINTTAGTQSGVHTITVTVTPCVVTVISNGLSEPLMFRHNETATSGYGLYVLPSTKAYSSLTYGGDLKASMMASLKDTLYWAGLTHYDNDTTEGVHDHRVIWSALKNISYYNEWTQYKDFTQGGDAVTGLKSVSGNLIVARERSMWQTAGGYGVFQPIPTLSGTNSPKSLVDYGGSLIYNSYGKILALGGSDQHLSAFIHTLFAGEGAQEDVCGTADPYSQKVYFSTGQKLFVYDFKYGTWGLDQFDEQVKIVSVTETGATAAGAWADPPALHDTLSVSAEDILCDPIIIQGRTKLRRSNHFYQNRPVEVVPDEPGEMSTTGGSGYEFIYEVPLIPLVENMGYGVVRGLEVEGEHSGPITIQGCFTETIKDPVWEDLGTVTLEDGAGTIDIDSGRVRYAAYRIITNDLTFCKISGLAMLISRGGRR